MLLADIFLIRIIVWIAFLKHTDAVTFHNSASLTSLSVNDDTEQTLWSISATCNPTNEYNNVTYSVGCDCALASTHGGIFSIDGTTVKKNACSTTTCGSCNSCSACSASNGCASVQTYSLLVTCSTSDYPNDDSGSQSFSLTVTAESPILSLTLTSPLSASRTTAQNTVLTTGSVNGGLTVRDWVEQTSVANSYIHGTTQLFKLNTGNGNVYVNRDLTSEYSYSYDLEVCVYTRRQSDCKTTTIDLSGCFQTPTCNDQTGNFSDTHATGDTLFNMDVDDPSAHFAALSPSWQGLSYAEVSKTLSVASLDTTTGEITTTGNITVHPSYPKADHTFVVRIMNSESCYYNTTCTMTFSVYFTNWPISITNEDANRTKSIHEDTDDRTQIFEIVTYDYNNPDHDNVSCTMTNPEPTMFELTKDGNDTYNNCTFYIYKKVCLDRGCGFLCDLNRACMNWNLTKSYSFDVTCSDAYGTDDTKTFTLNVNRNEIFTWRNLPQTITKDTDTVAFADILYSIMYADDERETLTYNYSVTPAQPTPALFGFDTTGNYYNNMANITSLIYNWNITNITYTILICGQDRRNFKCEDLTIQLREYCAPTPACNDGAVSVTDQTTVGTLLLTITPDATYAGATYAMTTEHTELFDIDSSTGQITTRAALAVTHPPENTVYTLSGFIYATDACAYGSCPLTVNVSFTNFNITITNVAGVSVDIHEDTTAEVTLLTIMTSDANDIDTVTCVVDEANSVPANNNKFLAREVDQYASVFTLISIEGAGFDYSVAQNYTVVVTCSDSYGSSDTANMTVTILENQEPTMTNLGNATLINVDPLTTFSGATLFTLETSDAENDALQYNCSVDNTWVPLECLSDGVVTLRRNVTIPAENGTIFNISMCINEPVHTHTICGLLQVNFTTSKTHPILNNLPSTIYFDETAAVSTIIFTITVEDPDAGESHVFSMSESPATNHSKFSLDQSSGAITLLSAFDYETGNNFNLTISVRDQYLTTLEEKTLIIYVNNTNESPTLTLYNTNFTTTEGSDGRDIGILNYTCTDPDINETLAVTLSAGTYLSYYSFSETFRNLTHALEWDFENGAGLPELVDLIVSCADDEGLSSTTTIFISISKVNEFAPVLNTVSENITIYSNQSIIDPLLTITATDSDYGDDGVFEFKIAGDGQGEKYFTFNSNGQLLLSDYLDWYYNFTFIFSLLVSDNETDALTSSVDVTVIYIAPEYIPILKKPTYCILCRTEGIIVVCALCFEALLLAACVLHICVRMNFMSLFRYKATPPTGIPRRKHRLKDTIRDLEKDSDDEEPELININDDTPSEEHDKYRPGSEMLNRAKPNKAPPAAFNYYKNPHNPSPPPPPVYYTPHAKINDIQKPPVSPTDVIPTSISTPLSPDLLYDERVPIHPRHRIRTLAELAPSDSPLKLPNKRRIPQLYNEAEPTPSQPHVPDVINPVFSGTNNNYSSSNLPKPTTRPEHAMDF